MQCAYESTRCDVTGREGTPVRPTIQEGLAISKLRNSALEDGK
jgi:hypothetical protein